jgi:hypothetical protein
MGMGPKRGLEDKTDWRTVSRNMTLTNVFILHGLVMIIFPIVLSIQFSGYDTVRPQYNLLTEINVYFKCLFNNPHDIGQSRDSEGIP